MRTWKMRTEENAELENEECRKCRVWKMRSMENEEYGKC